MDNTEPFNRHGGAREGAGRKAVGDTRVAIRLSDEQAKWLDEQCKELDINRSEFIRNLIDKSRTN